MNITKAIEDNYKKDLEDIDAKIKHLLEDLRELTIQRNKLNLHFFVSQINDRSLPQSKDVEMERSKGS